jgi:type VI secretion system secreted protein Hcp
MAFDAFLKLEGLDGESTRKGFEKQMEIMSFSLGATNPSTVGTGSGGSSGGKVSVGDFSVARMTDSASASLFAQLCSGKSYDSATVSMNKASGDDTPITYLKYDFQEVYVTNIQWSGSSGGSDTPIEHVSFSFGAMTITYTPQAEGGGPGDPVSSKWDIRKQASS